MTKEEALELLKNARRDDRPSAVNPSLTRAQGVAIVEKAVVSMPAGEVLSSIIEKRVYQVVRNQRQPRY